MQPTRRHVRMTVVMLTRRWQRLLTGGALAMVVSAGLGCGGSETAGPAVEPSAPGEAPAQTLVESRGSLFDETYELGGGPAFLPPIGFGVDTQECQLGSDPYSTCI